jgi:uncharacterized phage-like protein YoqJ
MDLIFSAEGSWSDRNGMTFSEQLYRDQLRGLQDAYEQSLFPRNEETYFIDDSLDAFADIYDEEEETT